VQLGERDGQPALGCQAARLSREGETQCCETGRSAALRLCRSRAGVADPVRVQERTPDERWMDVISSVFWRRQSSFDGCRPLALRGAYFSVLCDLISLNK
jgi:hypothetical protein